MELGPIYLVDVRNPCWIYRGANLSGARHIAVSVAALPFNYQFANEPGPEKLPHPAPQPELVVRRGCDGPLLAQATLAKAPRNGGESEIVAAIAATCATCRPLPHSCPADTQSAVGTGLDGTPPMTLILRGAAGRMGCAACRGSRRCLCRRTGRRRHCNRAARRHSARAVRRHGGRSSRLASRRDASCRKGAEILCHVGIETVGLRGKGFTAHVPLETGSMPARHY